MFASCALLCIHILTCFGARMKDFRADNSMAGGVEALALGSGTLQAGEDAWKRRPREEKPVTECIYNTDIVLTCPSDTEVGIITAFWSRRRVEGCAPEPEPPEDAGRSCHANATDVVAELCRGQEPGTCTVPAGLHGCDENPFTILRVRWYCGGPQVPRQTMAVAEEQGSLAHGMDEADTTPAESTSGTTTGGPAIEVDNLAPSKREQIQEWVEHPDKRVLPSSMKRNHCKLLRVGAYGDCEMVTKVGGHTSSPVIEGDHVCRCQYITNKHKFCDDVFASQQSVKTAQYTVGEVAIFGWEGCDCFHDSGIHWTCDLSVREVLN